MSQWIINNSMKCLVCEYEFEQSFDPDKSWDVFTTKGDREFIQIEGSFHVMVGECYDYKRIEAIRLYACPECGTVKIIV